MCSRRQNAAFRAPGTSCARQPSPGPIGSLHHEQLSVDCAAMLKIIVLEGDETGQELLDQALRVLDPAVTRVDVELEHYDLSLENRRKTGNDVVSAAAGVNRDEVREGAEELGVDFDEHVAFLIAAMEERVDELGLAQAPSSP